MRPFPMVQLNGLQATDMTVQLLKEEAGGWTKVEGGLTNASPKKLDLPEGTSFVFYWMRSKVKDVRGATFCLEFTLQPGQETFYSRPFQFVTHSNLLFDVEVKSMWPDYGPIDHRSLIRLEGSFKTNAPTTSRILFGDMEGAIKEIGQTFVKCSSPSYPEPATVDVVLHHNGTGVSCGSFTFQTKDEYEELAKSTVDQPPKRQRKIESEPVPPPSYPLDNPATWEPNLDLGEDLLPFYVFTGAIPELDKTSEVNQQDSQGFSLLHFAMERNQLEAASLLLKKGADVNAEDEDGVTPLHLAAKEGHLDMVRLLLSFKANPNAQNVYGDSPLHFAAAQGKEEVSQLLMKNGADVNLPNEANETPGQLAEEFGSPFPTAPAPPSKQAFEDVLSNVKDGELPRLFINTHKSTRKTKSNKYLDTFRAAVAIGDQVIEADAQGYARMVSIADYFKSPTLISVPMELQPQTDMKESIKQTCKVLGEWNEENSRSPCDPHQLPFVILKTLNLPSPNLKNLEGFLTQLVKMDTFRPTFYFRDEEIISHSQLDSLREEDDDEKLTSEEEHLLKAMDRVYWVRYFGTLSSSLTGDEKQEYLGNCEQSNCPFGNPAETQTLIGHGIEITKEEEQYLVEFKQLHV